MAKKAPAARTATDRSVADPAPVGRRDHILASAAQLFADQGIASTTVRDIGGAAGILSGSLYYHFDSKESIVEEIVREYLTGLLESYKAVLDQHTEPRPRLEGLIRAAFEAIDQHPHACEIYQNDYKALHAIQGFDELDALTAKAQRLWMTTINEGVKSGVLRGDIDAKLFYRFAQDAIWFTVRWYHPERGASVDALAATCTSILLDGYAAR